MAECTYADVDFLVKAWPGVFVELQAKWRLTIAAAATGAYVVDINGQPVTYNATAPPDTVVSIRDGVIAQLLIETALVSSIPFSNNRVDLLEVNAGTIETLTFAGPNAGDVLIEQTGPSDNTEQLQFWLDATECFVSCELPDCVQPLFHAAWAAHKMFTAPNTGAGGLNASDFEEWRLGPARLKKGAAVSGSSGDLDRTDPGKEIIEWRTMFVAPVACAPCCGVAC